MSVLESRMSLGSRVVKEERVSYCAAAFWVVRLGYLGSMRRR